MSNRTIRHLERVAEEYGQGDADGALLWWELEKLEPADAAGMLLGLWDGDPAVYDSLPAPDLSGQWADGRTVRDILEAADPDPDAMTGEDMALTAAETYETAFSQKVESQAARTLRALLDLEREAGAVCEDCLSEIANGDEREGEDAAERITLADSVEHDWMAVGFRLELDYNAETGEGVAEFSWSACDLCGSRLGGSRHRIAALAVIPWRKTVEAIAAGRYVRGRADMDPLGDLVENPHAWPGGYTRVLIMSDGGTLCRACALENVEEIRGSTGGDGWCAFGVDCLEGGDTVTCDHCYREVR